jgi:hypothetical protein
MAQIIIVDLGGLETAEDIQAAINAALTANPTYRFQCFGADWMPRKCAILQEA